MGTIYKSDILISDPPKKTNKNIWGVIVIASQKVFGTKFESTS